LGFLYESLVLEIEQLFGSSLPPDEDPYVIARDQARDYIIESCESWEVYVRQYKLLCMGLAKAAQI
jgi:hypothetical protein